ncbi:MAG: hypothetical protein IBX59_03755 [Yoonia sp.]|nr:hypothetical protein [Yoonia sp.]
MIVKHAFLQDKVISGDGVMRCRLSGISKEIPTELRRYVAALGPAPRNTLETFVDLSMSDNEIATYFDIPRHCIGKLRQIWNIIP